MMLSHWSGTPLGELYRVTQSPYDMKPRGLWLSVDGEDDWPHWCEGANFRSAGFSHRAIVTLKPDHNLLVITSPVELLDFTGLYSVNPLKDQPGFDMGTITKMFIDWARVSDDFDGIMIPQMLWGMRLDHRTGWYYSWDCSSGCIWNPEAIASVERMVVESDKDKVGLG